MADDPINHPAHYTWIPGIEPIEIAEHLPYCLGNALKYIVRADHKGADVQDIEKAQAGDPAAVEKIAAA